MICPQHTPNIFDLEDPQKLQKLEFYILRIHVSTVFHAQKCLTFGIKRAQRVARLALETYILSIVNI